MLIDDRFWNTTVGKVANTVMQLWMKSDTEHAWSLYQVNNLPTVINGWNIVMILVANVYVDATGRRMVVVVANLVSPWICFRDCADFSQCILIFGTICLIAWDIPVGLKIVAYMFAGTDGPLSPIYMAWANILCSSDSQLRALTIAIMNSAGAALTTVIQQFLYPVVDAPKYRKGFPASLGFIGGMCIWVFVVRRFEIRALRMKEVGVVGEGVESEGVESGSEMNGDGSEKAVGVEVSPAIKV